MIAEPNFDGPLKPIAEFVTRPDFPQCLLGEHVDIGGYTGVVVEIVNQSIKVRSPESTTKSFNMHGLRRLYAPAIRSEAVEVDRPEPRRASADESAETAPAPIHEVITEPDFDRDVKAIRVFASRSDFPKCAFGEYVEIRGYAGVVVEIVNQSLKVRSPEGSIRSYNATGLRKLFGQL